MGSISTSSAVAGLIIYLFLWIALLRDEWKIFPMGRGVSCLIGAVLYIISGVLTPEAAFHAIDIPTIALLTGCMLLSSHAEKAGLHAWLSRALAAGASPSSLLIRISIISAVSSALITNDTACIVLTPLVIDAARSARRAPLPFLVATATAANIGSALSPVGNPQNMIIAVVGGVKFVQFLQSIAISTCLGLLLNYIIIKNVYAIELNTIILDHDETENSPMVTTMTATTTDMAQVTTDDIITLPPSLSSSDVVVNVTNVDAAPTTATLTSTLPLDATTTMTTTSSAAVQILFPPLPSTTSLPHILTTATPATTAPTTPPVSNYRKRLRICILSIIPILLIVADFSIGLVWAVLLAAALLFAIDGVPPAPLVAKVDGGLLFFFSGLFICTAGLNATGFPASVWSAVAPYASLNSVSGLCVFSLLVLVGSNTISNVPLVLLLAPALLLLSPNDARRAWLILAWTSTVGGNLTLLGAVANVIVAERARAAGTSVTFVDWLRGGVPSTLLCLIIGTPIVWLISNI
jgi:Na+/H+ antiporter NhaD/arsenite permease-like protein